MNGQRRAVSTREAMKMLGVSKSTVARLIRIGELEAYKLTPGVTSDYRIYVDSIEKLLERRKQPTP